jgi:hypothetical protein
VIRYDHHIFQATTGTLLSWKCSGDGLKAGGTAVNWSNMASFAAQELFTGNEMEKSHLRKTWFNNNMKLSKVPGEDNVASCKK